MALISHYTGRGELRMTCGTATVRRRRAIPGIAAVRHESALLVNPLDARHIVGVAAPPDSMAVPAVRVSLDGGISWRRSTPLAIPFGCKALNSPVLAMDAQGRLHLALLALAANRAPAGIAVYHSDAAGLRWSAPELLFDSPGECSCALAADLNARSPYYGNVYLAADAGESLCFARYGQDALWTSADGSAPAALWPGLCSSPEVLVDAAGGVHLVWATGSFERSILAAHSTDGGRTFAQPALVARSVTDACDFFPETAPAAVIAPGGRALCAWADFREGRSRIYCRRSFDNGDTWSGPESGEPLLRRAPGAQHEFQPHLLATPNGELCCAYYEYGPSGAGGRPIVNLVMAVSYDRGATFHGPMVLSEHPWDPAVDPPLSRTATQGVLSGFASTPAPAR